MQSIPKSLWSWFGFAAHIKATFCRLHTSSEGKEKGAVWFVSTPEQTHVDVPTADWLSVNSPNSHWRHQGWQGHPCCMVRHVHAHTLTHRCSLFSQAAINLHAWGYKSIGGRKREAESQEGSLKWTGVSRSPFSRQIYWTGGRPHGAMHDWARWWSRVVCVTPATHDNVNWLAVVSNRLTRGRCVWQQRDLDAGNTENGI